MPEKPLCWKRFQPSAWESKDSYTAKGTGQGVDIGPAEILFDGHLQSLKREGRLRKSVVRHDIQCR
jgi:hypothetical protein